MTLIYAFGGGAGHLTRARALCHTLGLGERTPILCAQRQASEGRSGEGLHLERAPLGLEHNLPAFREWIQDALDRHQPKTLFVDTFPCGILGELADFSWPKSLELVLVGRILRQDIFAALSGTPPPYARTLLIEEVSDRQQQFLTEISTSIQRLELIDPPGQIEPEAAQVIEWLCRASGPVWIIVHSGPEEETAELLAYAREKAHLDGVAPRYLVVTDCPLPDPGDDATMVSIFPAQVLFPYADKIVTACGSNSIRQSRDWAEKRLCLPFGRRFDDQFLRRRLTR